MHSKKNKKDIYKHLKLTSTMLVFVYITNRFFNHSLTKLSIELSYKLQENFELELFSVFFSSALFYLLFLIQCFWVFIFKYKKDAIFYSLLLYINVSVTSVLRMIMGEHRPSFLDIRLTDHNRHYCDSDYGMPSSHTFLVVLMCCYTFE